MKFKERSKLAMEVLSKQPSVTLEEARLQVAEIKRAKSVSNYIKQITEKYDLEKHELDEMKFLLTEFVKVMDNEEIIEILKDYGICI